MKKMIFLLLVLSFTAGFTCSKNSPEQPAPSKEELGTPEPDQSEMAVDPNKTEELPQPATTEPASENK